MRPAHTLQSVYDRCGGFAAVSAVVMTFYDLVLDDDRIGRFFDAVDMARLVDHQTKFVAHVMGGPTEFSGARIGQAHRRLGIDDGDMDRIMGLMDAAMRTHDIDPDDRAVVIEAMEAHRTLIVAPEGRS